MEKKTADHQGYFHLEFNVSISRKEPISEDQEAVKIVNALHEEKSFIGISPRQFHSMSEDEIKNILLVLQQGAIGTYDAVKEIMKLAASSINVGMKDTDPQEIWDDYSEFIDDDINSLQQVAASTIITQREFKKLSEEYSFVKKQNL